MKCKDIQCDNLITYCELYLCSKEDGELPLLSWDNRDIDNCTSIEGEVLYSDNNINNIENILSLYYKTANRLENDEIWESYENY